jgi:hypothetical protein
MGHRTEGIHHIALVGHAGVLADALLIGAKAIPAKGGVSVPGDGRRSPAERELAIEALRKLINGDVRSQAKRNVTQAKTFSERLEAAIARYHTNALTTAQVLEELIHLAKDIRAARLRGEE